MNRNTNTFQRDGVAISISRSKKNLSHSHKSTFKAGYLYPIWSYSDILPGDTIKLNLSSLIRMSTPVGPVMDDVYADVYCFFVPHKLTLQRYSQPNSATSYSWKYFMGAQDYFLNMPLPASDVKLPVIGWMGNDVNFPSDSFYDHLGLTLLGSNQSDYPDIHALDYLAYTTVWNDFFRDENTEQPLAFALTTLLDGSVEPYYYGGPWSENGSDPVTMALNGHDILPVCRPHGYFGSALPFPQRSAEGVTIPLLGTAIVEADGYLQLYGVDGNGVNVSPLNVYTNGSSAVAPGSSSTIAFYNASTGEGAGSVKGFSQLGYSSGLRVNLEDVSSVTVNQFRALVAKQHYLEALARGGNRLGEMTSSLFGVRPHDSGEEHAEYLGGKRIPINVAEVAQMTQNSDGKGLGYLGAYSKTLDQSFMFEKSFDTWGTLAVYICFRTNESFHQGIARRFTRSVKEDFYYPAFARIGDQPIKNAEIYWTDAADVNDGVFGYQSAWAEYAYEPDTVSGLLRPSKSLGYFTFTNNFESLPTLAGYLKGGDGIKANVDRVLQVSSGTSGWQFMGDFYFACEAIRPMPADTRPGLTRI